MPVINAHPHLAPICQPHQPKTLQNLKTNLPKSTQPRQNAPANPRRVLPLRRREDLDAHILDGHALHLRQQAVAEPLGECAAAGEHNVGVQVLAQVQIRAVDRVDDDLVHAWVFEADDLGVEENFGGAEAFGADLTVSVSAKQVFDSVAGHTLSLFPSGSTYSASFP